tara:strand:+ start:89 stop:547 length:459 start_codon:yes stop_codon:yes gene_type:complete
MTRTVLVSTSPEPEGVAKTIALGFNVPVDRVTYDGELGGEHAGYLFTAEIKGGSVTQVMLQEIENLLSSAGYTSQTMFFRDNFRVHVHKKHNKYLWFAFALSVVALAQCIDVHKKPIERVVEQWLDPTWRFIAFYFQKLRLPNTADEWRHFG